jgi:hypothetical protein
MALPGDGGMSDVQRQLAELLLEEKLEARNEKQRKASQQRAFAESMAIQAREQAESDKALQNSCNHLKQNGKTRVVGQSNSDFTATVLCQGCRKTWRNEGKGWFDTDGKSMPAQAYPDPDMLGGSMGGFLIRQAG